MACPINASSFEDPGGISKAARIPNPVRVTIAHGSIKGVDVHPIAAPDSAPVHRSKSRLRNTGPHHRPPSAPDSVWRGLIRGDVEQDWLQGFAAVIVLVIAPSLP